MVPKSEWKERVRSLNDQMRARGPESSEASRWVMTPGLVALGAENVGAVIGQVRTFSDFTRDNDPYGEHDFGSVEVAGQRVFWKIDYYDRGLVDGSSDPADETVTCRVLTIMLAMEY